MPVAFYIHAQHLQASFRPTQSSRPAYRLMKECAAAAGAAVDMCTSCCVPLLFKSFR